MSKKLSEKLRAHTCVSHCAPCFNKYKYQEWAEEAAYLEATFDALTAENAEWFRKSNEDLRERNELRERIVELEAKRAALSLAHDEYLIANCLTRITEKPK
jgi:hypothetical protein